jgi:hypothetical protein
MRSCGRPRLEVARRNRRWHELQEVNLVARHRGWLVSATTDEIFSPYRGAVWVPDSVAVVSDMAELWFYVTADEIHFLERVNPPATYTQWLEQRAAKELRKARSEAEARAGRMSVDAFEREWTAKVAPIRI